MTYGILIPNIVSPDSTPETFPSARLVAVIQCRAFSGTASIPEFDSSIGFFFCMVNNEALAIPRCTFNNDTKVFTWQSGGVGNINDLAWSRNFDVLFMHTS